MTEVDKLLIELEPELEIFRTYEHHPIHITDHRIDYFSPLKEIVHTKDNVIFTANHELLTNEFDMLLYKLINEIRISGKKTLRISMATSAKIPYGLNPLVNILIWSGVFIRKNVITDGSEVDAYPRSLFENKDVNSFNKSNRGILSVRRRRSIRDIIFSELSEFKGICRYHRWQNNIETQYPDDKNDSFSKFKSDDISFTQLRDEYISSHISFIIESTHGSHKDYAPSMLTEKSLLGFITGTMPIILSGPNFVRELEDMGLKVWNKEFGWGDGDFYGAESTMRAYPFLDCIHTYNNMSDSEIESLWKSNYYHIQKNYEIVSKILYSRWK